MKFKSLFFEDDSIAAPKPQASQQSLVVPTMTMPMSAPMVAGPDPEIRAALLQSINEKKLPGYDYLKYIAALEEMKSMVPAEDARFRMAFITAKQFGIDKSKLAETGKHYLQVLNEDAREFQEHLNEKMQESVTAREKQLADLDSQIQSRQMQIEKLSAEIQAAQMQRNDLASQVAETRAKLDSKKRSFEVTHAGCVAEIEANIQKINQYLQ
jgi:chromosome segregation ATPase